MAALNYTNRNLQNYNFQGQDLTGADFTDADLRGCNFTGATLVGARLQAVQTGQSPRQIGRSLLTAIVGPFLLLGICFLVAQFLILPLNEQAQRTVMVLLPMLAGILQLFQAQIVQLFPRFSNFCALACISGLLGLMVLLTLGLGVIGLTGGGLWLLGLMLAFGAIDWIIFGWLVNAIYSQPGTSFRRANLTDADLSNAQIQNTDFSQAVLTGACVSGLLINRHTQFSQTYCEHLFLAPNFEQRQPETGTLQPGELATVLAPFNFNPRS